MLEKLNTPLPAWFKKVDPLKTSFSREEAVAREIADAPVDPNFDADMYDFLTGNRSGCFFHHVLTGPSFKLYDDFTRAAGSPYPFNVEGKLIRDNTDWIRDMAGIRGNETSLGIELGTGTDWGVANKTLPFIEAINASVLVEVDLAEQAALNGIELVRERYPQMAAFARKNDFNTDDLRIEWDHFKNPILESIQDGKHSGMVLPDVLPKHRVMFQFGGTLENAEGFPDDPLPEASVTRAMQNYHRHLRKGDTFFIGLHESKDQKSIDRGYPKELIARFSMELLWRIKEEMPVKNFNPDDFEYDRVWYPKTYLYAHGFRAKKDGAFILQDRETGDDLKISYKGGEMFRLFCNSYKFPAGFRERVTQKGNFTLKGSLMDPETGIGIHALTA